MDEHFSGDEERIVFDPTKQPAIQPDKYTECPYFPEHKLRVSRLPYHLIKCQNAPNAPKLLACPYNYLHRVKPENQREHILVCEDKIMVKYADKNPPSVANTRKQIQMLGGKLLDSKSDNQGSSTTDDNGSEEQEEEEELW